MTHTSDKHFTDEELELVARQGGRHVHESSERQSDVPE